MHAALPIGSRRRMANGYMKVKIGPGYKDWVYEHRHVMEQHLGRRLTRWENVHHRDEDKTHNELANLELIEQRTHNSRHSRGRTRSALHDEAVRLYRSGLSVGGIALQLGRSPSTISHHIRRAGLSEGRPSRVPELRGRISALAEAGLSTYEIARQVGRSQGTVANHITRARLNQEG